MCLPKRRPWKRLLCSKFGPINLQTFFGGRASSQTRIWQQCYGYPAEHSTWALFNLGDNPSARTVWSGSCGRVPSPRTNGAKLYSPRQRRWLLDSELLSAFGAPLKRHHADAAGISPWQIPPHVRLSSVIGLLTLTQALCLCCCVLAALFLGNLLARC